MKAGAIVVLAATSVLLSGTSEAGPEKFAGKGVIDNAAGVPCAYRQQVISNALHFHGDAISTTIGELIFDDPQCMRDSGSGLDANKASISRVISTWYSHPDADFDTENLRKTSLYQEVGVCMQSRNYAAIGIAIDFVVSEDSIVRVFHGPTLEGCLS